MYSMIRWDEKRGEENEKGREENSDICFPHNLSHLNKNAQDGHTNQISHVT